MIALNSQFRSKEVLLIVFSKARPKTLGLTERRSCLEILVFVDYPPVSFRGLSYFSSALSSIRQMETLYREADEND